MISRFITEVNTKFNPYSLKAKTCRVFLAQFGPTAWPNVKFKTQMLPMTSQEKSSLYIKFRMLPRPSFNPSSADLREEDGKEMKLDTDNLSFQDVTEEVDRHSRLLSRKAELAG